VAVGWSALVPTARADNAPAPAPARCKPALVHPAAKDDLFPPPPSDTRGFDVLSYDLELRLDPPGRAISGSVEIGLSALTSGSGAGLTTVQLDLVPELTVTQVRDTQGALSFTHTDSRLEIALPQPLPGGAVARIQISWQGRPPRHGSFLAGLMFRSHDAGTPADPDDDMPIVANLSQPWSAHSWWPCKDHPADKALVSLAVTVPDDLAAVSNGVLLDVSTPEPGWRRYAWREQYPLPTYLVSVAASDYESWSELCAPTIGTPVQLEYHVFPQDRANAAYDLALTCEMMSFLSEVCGPWPYPGEKYAQVEFKWIGGMEHTTATSLAQLLFTGDRRFENLFVHELAHQWFGDSLTPATWSDIWLNEGFARYSEALWVEQRYGRQAYLDFMAEIGPLRHPDLFRGEGILADPDPILPNELVYDKGAWVLHMMRALIGDAAFFDFLSSYANDPDLVHGLVRQADMIAAAEAAAGRSLRNFFGPWLETDLVPVVSLSVAQPQPGLVNVTLTQHQQPAFEVPVPIAIYGACGTLRSTVALTAVRQTFSWKVPCAVDSVRIAPAGLALLRGRGAASAPLTVRGPAPNPASAAGSEFVLFLTEDSEVVVNIYDARGRKITDEISLGVLAATESAADTDPMGHPWRWNPGSAGEPAPASGLYFLEFRGNGGRQVRRLTVIR
jgi:aminopeptidase N